MILHPSGRTAHHLNASLERTQIVAISGCRRCKLNCHVGRGKLRRVEVLLVVNIYDTHNFVATLLADRLNHLAHLAVADKCYVHCFECFFVYGICVHRGEEYMCLTTVIARNKAPAQVSVPRP